MIPIVVNDCVYILALQYVNGFASAPTLELDNLYALICLPFTTNTGADPTRPDLPVGFVVGTTFLL